MLGFAGRIDRLEEPYGAEGPGRHGDIAAPKIAIGTSWTGYAGRVRDPHVPCLGLGTRVQIAA